MYERLLLLRELLADGGVLCLHCDSSKGHHLRALLDEVFGEGGFLNELIWAYRRWPSESRSLQAMHDTILIYRRSVARGHTFHVTYEEASESYLERFGGKTQVLDTETGTRKLTVDEPTKGMPRRDVWDMPIIAGFKGERLGYPTQKPEQLVSELVKTWSNDGDVVLDCFIGSGTTAAVAQKLGRRWIGCDINKGAIQTTSKRLQAIMREQAAEKARVSSGGMQPSFLADDGREALAPCAQLAFATWRVNDYDLQVQHNEAVALACEHIGVQRTRTDVFFDGTLGKSLVKITPFDHPLSPLDVQEVQRELRSRPDEDRPVALVCLGIETAARAAVDEWNRLRKGARAANRFEVVELRTDPKYGRFLRHVPASAKVTVKRSGGRIVVEIQDFLSPSIVERLRDQAGVLHPRIDDWRAMVDSVAIDANFDGDVFDVTLADVPVRKADLVAGRYEIEAPVGETTVAVRITDMLGEEVLVTAHV
jgi:hypothetical protein